MRPKHGIYSIPCLVMHSAQLYILTYVDYVFQAGKFEGHAVDLKSDFWQGVEFTAVKHVLTRKINEYRYLM